MKFYKIKIFLLLLSCISLNAQSIYDTSQINFEVNGSICGDSTGVVIFHTGNIPNVSYKWQAGMDTIDSIAFNLKNGSYSVNLLLPDGQELAYSVYIPFLHDCIPYDNVLNDFSYNSVGDGIVNFYQNNYYVKKIEWNMGDGTYYSNFREEFKHLFNSPGTYNVCMKLYGKYETKEYCQQIIVPPFSTSITNYSIIGSKKNQLNYINDNCECGGRKFFIGTRQNQPVSKLYVLNEDLDSLIALPIDQLVGGINSNFKYACFNSKLYFSGKIGNSGFELCESDGTFAGTRIVKDFTSIDYYTAINPNNFTIVNNKLYMEGNMEYPGGSTSSVYSFDGANISRENQINYRGINESLNYQNNLIFTYNNLMKFDGSLLTHLVSSNCNSALLEELNGVLYFFNYNSFDLSNTGLWRTDGSINGTSLVKNLKSFSLPSIHSKAVLNGKLYFAGKDLNSNEFQLFVTDGSINGTHIVKDIYVGNGDNYFFDFTVLNGKLYFVVSENYYFGHELWETDGSSSGTKRVFEPGANIIDRLEDSHPEKKIFIYNGKLLYYSNTQLWTYNTFNNTSEPVFFPCGTSIYSKNRNWISSDGKFHFFSLTSNGNIFYELCEINVPKLTSQIVRYKSVVNLQTLPNHNIQTFTDNEHCNKIRDSNNLNFIANYESFFYYNIVNSIGCQSKRNRLSIYLYDDLKILIREIARCENNIVNLRLRISDNFPSDNQMFLRFSFPNQNSFQDVLLQKNGDFFSCEIPNFYKIGSVRVSVVASYEGIQSDPIIMPTFIQSNTLYLLGSKKISSGQKCRVTVFFKGLSPYQFTLNGQNYSSEKNLFQTAFFPTENLQVNISNSSYYCGSTNNPYLNVNFVISKCFDQINHSDSIIPNSYSSIYSISSSGSILPIQKLNYFSEKSILLSPGFEIPQSGVFSADIKNCQD